LRDAGWSAAGALALGAAPARPFASEETREGEPIEPGLQLYTVRHLLETDFRGTLEQVAKIGYREVQVSPRAGHTPAEIRAMLDDAGLVCPSIHLDPRRSTSEEIEAAGMLGAKYVFLSAPIQVFRIQSGQVVGLRDDLSLDEYRAIADELDVTGAAFRQAGLVFGYHNHSFEFLPIDGVLPFDVLTARTDPALVAIELDLGWLQVGGADPLAYIERYPGRFPVCHVKDVLADGSFVDPGTGTVDFARTFAHASQAGLRHYFVEHDTTTDPLATARAGHAYLRGLRAY
jgi:sugar phosphate isomerase/epimerase